MIGRWIEEHVPGLAIQAEPEHRGHSTFGNFDLGGVEIEVGEFLYGLVRIMKPEHIMETGTRLGISAAFMALALAENGSGRLTTIEINADYSTQAAELMVSLGVRDYVELVVGKAENFQPSGHYDMIFLDTDLQFRFGNWARLWPYLRPGGLLAIHDLHSHMAQIGEVRAFGPVPPEIVELIRTHDLQSLHLQTPRGFYLCQKSTTLMHSIRILRGQV